MSSGRTGICSRLEDVLTRDTQSMLCEVQRADERVAIAQRASARALAVLAWLCLPLAVDFAVSVILMLSSGSLLDSSINTKVHATILCLFGGLATLGTILYCFAHIRLEAQRTVLAYYTACIDANNTTLYLLRYHDDVWQSPGFLTSIGGWSYAGSEISYSTYAEAIHAKAMENHAQ